MIRLPNSIICKSYHFCPPMIFEWLSNGTAMFSFAFESLKKWNYIFLLANTIEVGGGLIGYVKSKPLGNGQIISIDVLVVVMIIAVFHEKLIWPPVRAISKLKRHLLDLTLWTTVLRATTTIDRWRHMYFYWKRKNKMRGNSIWNIWTLIKWEAKLANLKGTPLMELNL